MERQKMVSAEYTHVIRLELVENILESVFLFPQSHSCV